MDPRPPLIRTPTLAFCVLVLDHKSLLGFKVMLLILHHQRVVVGVVVNVPFITVPGGMKEHPPPPQPIFGGRPLLKKKSHSLSCRLYALVIFASDFAFCRKLRNDLAHLGHFFF